jgi:aspartate/methionine/tyrosine aminotransferase
MPAFNPAMLATTPPPVMEARRWLDGATFPPDRPLINLSQAAPIDPPPEPLRAAMAEMVLADPGTHLYGPVLGLPALREAIATRWSAAYGGGDRAHRRRDHPGLQPGVLHRRSPASPRRATR